MNNKVDFHGIKVLSDQKYKELDIDTIEPGTLLLVESNKNTSIIDNIKADIILIKDKINLILEQQDEIYTWLSDLEVEINNREQYFYIEKNLIKDEPIELVKIVEQANMQIKIFANGILDGVYHNGNGNNIVIEERKILYYPTFSGQATIRIIANGLRWDIE